MNELERSTGAVATRHAATMGDRLPPHFGVVALISLALGAAAVVPAGIFGLAVFKLAAHYDSEMRHLIQGFLAAAFPEEICRFIVVTFLITRVSAANKWQCLLIGAITSIGFSTAENTLYGVIIGAEMGLFKFAIATPIHLSLGVIMGSLIGTFRSRTNRRKRWLASALAAPMALHAVYDYALFQAFTNNGHVEVWRHEIGLAAVAYAAIIAVAAIVGRQAYRDDWRHQPLTVRFFH